jgi:hypothetical protein
MPGNGRSGSGFEVTSETHDAQEPAGVQATKAWGYRLFELELTPEDEEALGDYRGSFRSTTRYVWMMVALTVIGLFFTGLILVAMHLSSQDGDPPPTAEYIFLVVFALMGLGSPLGIVAAVRQRNECIHLFEGGLVDVGPRHRTTVFKWQDVIAVLRTSVVSQVARHEVRRSCSLILRTGPAVMLGQHYGNSEPLLQAIETAIAEGHLPRPAD